MNVDLIVAELKIKYPGKEIIVDDTEIIVEIKPGLALAIVGKSKPHYHKISTEIYDVTKGVLSLFVDGKKFILNQGEKMTITPNQVHYTEGENT